ncbi:MAG TPA: hypothetical protein PKH39_00710 [Woeseiaceae bacterium]|nr:hypothetical protein [Woeseiaceae bacterium]
MFLILEPSVVTSPCPLLPAEPASDFSPQVCMRVPTHSAWVPLQVDLSAFVAGDGTLALGALKNRLECCVDEGDTLHDQTEWSDSLVEYDSWLNRRLAIALRGWGDIVKSRGDDPTSLQTLRDMEELAEWACQVLHDRSRYLAVTSSWCPALDEAGSLVMQTKQSRRWGRRWRRALQDVAVRHRNLTTISPWDVFPRDQPADLRYADLLPLTRFADSLAFQRDASIEHWNVNDFRGFHERLAAIVRCHGGAGLVAKQV